MNDTHYYIPNIPSNCLNSLFYVTGLLFEQVPGRYYLPLMEGEYSIFPKDGLQMINMRTNGTMNVYSHSNMAVKNCDLLIDLGYLRVFFGRYNSR